MSKTDAAERSSSATTDAPISEHIARDKYGYPYTYFRCEGCGDEAYYRRDLERGCGC